MKVAIVLHTDPFEPWPVLRAVREAELLRDQGKSVTIVSWIKDPSHSKSPTREVRDGIVVLRVREMPGRGLVSRLLAYRRATRGIAGTVERLRPDGIVCHDLEMLRPSRRAARRLRVPLLYHAHEDWPAMVSERSRLEGALFTLAERRWLRDVDHVYTIGRGLAAKFERMGKAVTVQYGSKAAASLPIVDEARRRSLRSAHGLGSDDFLVGLAGSLGRDEALPEIFRAIHELPVSVKLVVVGGLPARVASARALAAAHEVAERTRFTGPLSTREYIELVGALDVGLAVFHATSANIAHVVPLKLFDYMAMGVPAVVSDFPEMRRLVVDEVGFGVAIDPQPDRLRIAIADLMNDSVARRDMSARARAAFAATYCWERQAERLASSHRLFAPRN